MDNVQQSQEQEKPIYSDLASASDALLARWEDASEPSDQATEEATATADEETEELEQEQEIQGHHHDAAVDLGQRQPAG